MRSFTCVPSMGQMVPSDCGGRTGRIAPPALPHPLQRLCLFSAPAVSFFRIPSVSCPALPRHPCRLSLFSASTSVGSSSLPRPPPLAVPFLRAGCSSLQPPPLAVLLFGTDCSALPRPLSSAVPLFSPLCLSLSSVPAAPFFRAGCVVQLLRHRSSSVVVSAPRRA